MTTIFALFPTYHQANDAIVALGNTGFASQEVDVFGKEDVLQIKQPVSATEQGATGGALVGGIGGLLLSAAALTIPGVGPVIGAGTIIIATLGTTAAGAGIGAVIGGLAGVLADLGMGEDQAEAYVERIRSGHIMVAVRAHNQVRANEAELILQNFGARDISRHKTTQERVAA